MKGVWELSVLFLQLFYKSKITQKHKFHLNKFMKYVSNSKS